MEYTEMSRDEQVFIVKDRIRVIESNHFSVSLNIAEVEAARDTYFPADYDATMAELLRQRERCVIQVSILKEFLATGSEGEVPPDENPEVVPEEG